MVVFVTSVMEELEPGKEKAMETMRESNGKEREKEEAYAYALACIPGVGSGKIVKLYETLGSFERAYWEFEKVLPEEGKEISGNGLCARNREKVAEEYEKLCERKIRIFPYGLFGYPDRLKEIPRPPSQLFVKGCVFDEKCLSVAIVGTRNCSSYGENVAMELGERMAEEGIAVISGMARGVDSVSQNAAFSADGTTFGVLGSGVDVCYPKESRRLYDCLCEGHNGGGVLSEYLPGQAPHPNLFPARNRIISGLADALVVVEAKERSGTAITVKDALEQGRDIYAVPGSIWNERSYGCNKWLKEGAQVLYDMDVFIEELKESWEYHRNLTAGCDTDDGFGLFDMRKVKSTVESGIISGIKPIEDIRKKGAAEASEICERKKIDINVFRSERIRNLTPIQQDVYLALNARFQGVDNIMTRVPEPVLLPVLIATLNELEHMGLASSDCGRFRRM